MYLRSYFFWSFQGKKPGEMTADEIDVVVTLLQPCNVAYTKCKYECSTFSLNPKTKTSIQEINIAEETSLYCQKMISDIGWRLRKVSNCLDPQSSFYNIRNSCHTVSNSAIYLLDWLSWEERCFWLFLFLNRTQIHKSE